MFRVGVKYCGGCNPEYDRVALVEWIEKALQGKVTFLPPENDDVDIILAVNGCRTACADLKSFGGIETRTVTSNEEWGKFIREFNKKA